MFIPLSEVPSRAMGSGEERHYFLFHERNPELPVEVVITRLPPLFGAEKNWHQHDFVEEFSVPLTGEIIIREKNDGKIQKRRHISKAILKDAEWVAGVACESDRQVTLYIEHPAGTRREVEITFDPRYTEGKELHTVENPTSDMITMVTMKRVPKKILRKDPLIFRVDRIPPFEER